MKAITLNRLHVSYKTSPPTVSVTGPVVLNPQMIEMAESVPDVGTCVWLKTIDGRILEWYVAEPVMDVCAMWMAALEQPRPVWRPLTFVQFTILVLINAVIWLTVR